MISRKIVLPALLLSLVAGSGISAGAAKAQTTKKKATAGTSKSSGSKAHRGTKKSGKNSRQRGQKAPTPDRINEIQMALAKNGSFTGEPNGKWDDSTVSAMKKYQASHGLNPTGRLDAPTLQKLGLGSTTAGVAPPQTPPGAVSRLTSSKFNSAEPSSENQR
ncbi:MAG TPA: peptidoglycan-binding domain-containing protein [Candidatus Acidoferrum sp.]|nr:peptidoglycan-binding domain-containing protein [Candidatus Acidoferrum sp.]